MPPRFSVEVPCCGGTHRIHVIDGMPVSGEHGDAEKILGAFGAPAPQCERISRAVHRSRHQLALAEWFTAAGLTDQYEKHGRSTAAYHREEEMDALAIPVLFRRLALLHNLRCEAASDAPTAAARVKRRTLICFRESVGQDADNWKVRIGPRADARKTLRPGSSRVVTLGANWLSSVFLFGLERSAGHLTIDLSVEGSSLLLTQVGTRSADVKPTVRRVPASVVLPSVQFL